MKAKSEAAKRAAKKLARARVEGLPELASVKRNMKKRGRERMREIKTEADAAIPALTARCRQLGIKPTDTALRDARAPWQGCSAGRAMSSVVSDETERAGLWAAIQHMRKVQLAYDRAMGAPNRHPQCLRIMLPSDEMSADAATPPRDQRTDEERQRDADRAWMAVQEWLCFAKPADARICKAVVIDDARCPDPAAMVAALRCVADGVEGRKIVYRGS